MFTKSALYYDRIYAFKDYLEEINILRSIIDEKLKSGGNQLLDVACGTGHHLSYFQDHFEVVGLDISPQLLEIARERNPKILFHEGDMIDFDLGRTFDIITCLFSSIGYVRTLENLDKAVGCMVRHLKTGGVLIVEPWFSPQAWEPNTVHAVFIDDPELKIARVNTSNASGKLSYFDLHYVIGTPQGTEHFVERHELGLFEVEETIQVFEKHGLEVGYDEQGLMGRGLFVGKKSA